MCMAYTYLVLYRFCFWLGSGWKEEILWEIYVQTFEVFFSTSSCRITAHWFLDYFVFRRHFLYAFSFVKAYLFSWTQIPDLLCSTYLCLKYEMKSQGLFLVLSFSSARVRKININEILKTESMVVTCQTCVNVVCIHSNLKELFFFKTQRDRELGPMGGEGYSTMLCAPTAKSLTNDCFPLLVHA